MSRTESNAGGPAKSKLDVWVVEDDRLLREGLRDLLDEQSDMRCGHAVDSCEDFVSALDSSKAPDIVLMDIGLPGRSGIEGVLHVKSLAPATKVIIVTIHGEDEKVFDAICAGASGYLLKPSRPGALVDAIRAVQEGAAPINPYIASKILGMFARLPTPGPFDAYGLTRREKDILQVLVDGLTLAEIARKLDLSYHTINNHLRSIYRKLHVRSRSRAVAKALREDLI